MREMDIEVQKMLDGQETAQEAAAATQKQWEAEFAKIARDRTRWRRGVTRRAAVLAGSSRAFHAAPDRIPKKACAA